MLDFPATHRNRDAIVEVLGQIWDPQQGLSFLEIASGSGQHACYFANRFPHWTIQPSDYEEEHVLSVEAYRRDQGLENLLPAFQLDVTSTDWKAKGPFDAVWAINLIHISPWACTEALFRNSRSVLKQTGSRILLYGAFRRNGEHTSPSNAAFDQGLKAQNSEWGVRCLDEVEAVALELGYILERVQEMPANNLTAIFCRA